MDKDDRGRLKRVFGEEWLSVNQAEAVVMPTFETSATVEKQGQVRVAGVPFAPGTEVEVTIIPKRRRAALSGLRRAGWRRPATKLRHRSQIVLRHFEHLPQRLHVAGLRGLA